ncbi:hypothetical protein BY458DRAFT_8314 [Sporodiniella umbellata]|nr:hypothetical protein BY458DRAFT_8314 [Sporodiniella umbellata]
MYFDLPKNSNRKPVKHSKVAEERISEILNNVEDHWGSPPILTPDTLAFILNHQWENDKKTLEEETKKSNYQLLIKEFCK